MAKPVKSVAPKGNPTPKTPKQIQGPQRVSPPPGIWKKYVDPASSKAIDGEEGMGMMSSMVEVVPVDKDYAFVPTEVTQVDKESTENLQKVMDTTMDRFGLKY